MSQTTQTVSEPNQSIATVLTCHDEPPGELWYQIVPIEVHGRTRVKTYALLDGGSAVTLIDADFAARIGLDGTTSDLRLRWTDERVDTFASKTMNVSINGIGTGDAVHTLVGVRTKPKLDLPMQSLEWQQNGACYEHLRDLPIARYRDAQPTMLIGLDNSDLWAPSKVRSGRGNGPIAIKTKLGWVVYGKCKPVPPSRLLHHRVYRKQQDDV